ncbi:hypothetical protein LLEC1_04265, partial [Akanthomyces lecanii]
MFAPAAAQLADDFHITSSTIVSFTVSIYILGYAIGPLLLSPMSELYGRLIMYRACGVVYTIAGAVTVATFFLMKETLEPFLLGERLMMRGTTGRSGEPERRPLPLLWFSLVPPVGLFGYGWSADKAAPWIVTILGTLLIGVGSMMILIPVQSYLVDAFNREAAASAIAAATIVRSFFGAFFATYWPVLVSAFWSRYGEMLTVRFLLK